MSYGLKTKRLKIVITYLYGCKGEYRQSPIFLLNLNFFLDVDIGIFTGEC